MCRSWLESGRAVVYVPLDLAHSCPRFLRRGSTEFHSTALAFANVQRSVPAHFKQPFAHMIADPIAVLLAQAKEHLLHDITRAVAVVQEPGCVSQQRFPIAIQRLCNPGLVLGIHRMGYG